MGNFCYSVVKYLLFFINFLFVISGAAVVAIGVLFRLRIPLDETGIVQFVTYTIIGLGCVVTLISFSGCCGAVAEVRCLLMTYSIIMLLLALANIAIVVVVYIFKINWQMQLGTILDHLFDVNKEAFHFLETTLECCGTTGPGSYPPVLSLPPYCCHSKSLTICTSAEASTVGCTELVSAVFMYYANNAIYYMIGIIAFEFLTVVSSIYLFRSMNEKLKF